MNEVREFNMDFVNNKLLVLLEKQNFLYKVSAIIILVIIGLITYHNIFDNSFHFDDSVFLQLDQVINKDYWGLTRFNLFRVVPFSTFVHDYHSYGNETAGYFYFNLSVHILNAVMCFSLLLLIFKTPRIKDMEIAKYAPIIAFLGSLVYLTHPIQTQAVAYIYQRLASMAAFFYLSSCVLYLSFRLSALRINRIVYFSLMVITFILGLFTKENTFTLPITLFIFELILFKKHLKIRPKIIIIIVSVVAALVILAQLGLGFDKIFAPQKSPYNDIITSENYLLTQFRVLSTYWRLLFLPYGQHLDHYFPLSESFFEVKTLLGFLFNLSIIGVGFLSLKKHPLISLGVFWFYITIIIESSVIPIKDVLFEHRLYLPMFGFLLIVLYVCFRFINKKFFDYIVIFFIMVSILFSYLSYQRNRVWQNDGTLWTDTIRKSPLNSRAWNNRGLYFFRNQKYEVAIYNFSKAIELKPNYAEPYSNRGTTYFFVRQYKKSLDDFNSSIQLNPKVPDTYLNRSNIHMILGDYVAAINDLYRLRWTRFNDAYSYMGMARSHRELKNWEEAIRYYEICIIIEPKNPALYINLALCYTLVNNNDKALNTLERGLESNPNDPELISRKSELLRQIHNK
jgi:Tfp pilus assembly protein PilF